MLAINHLTGGLTFTATFCAFQDVNIFEKPEYLALTIFGSLAPDIDNTKSIIGKVFYPIAKKIQEHWGHRTVTHSFLACIVFTMLFATIQAMTGAEHLTTIAFFSYLSHLIFDMCTKSGLPFFYPLNRYRCVLPANPNLRLRTGDIKQEAIVFMCFVGLNLLSVDLVANGFWSTYNKAFLTFAHLQRELLHNPKPLEVTIQEKSTGKISKAYVVEAGTDKAMLLDSVHFFEASTMNDKILDFEHIEGKEITEVIFEQVSVDSVNRLVVGKNVLEAKIFGDKEFSYRHEILRTATSINIEMTTGLMLYELVDISEEEDLQIKLLRIKIFEERGKKMDSKFELKDLEIELSNLEEGYDNLSNFEKTKAIKKIKKLKDKINDFEIYEPQTKEYEAKLSKLKNKEIVPTKFSGVVKTINFKE